MIQQLIELKFLAPITPLEKEPWNQEYEALWFTDSHATYRCRMAKKTPRKNGYFLTLWEKHEGVNTPFTTENFSENLLVFILDGTHQGYFCFPREELTRRGILASEQRKGKMAFRVYPPWRKQLNTSATKTQAWQILHFHHLPKTL